MVSPNSRSGQWESISNIIPYSLVLIFDLKHVKCGGGLGEGGNIVPTFVEKINSGNKNIFFKYFFV